MASTDKKNVISSLIESGKAKGKLSTKDITDALEELDYDVEQVDKLYSMLEGQNIEIVEEGASLDDDLDKLDLEGEDSEDALDLSFVDGVNIDDPVKVYLKEIGRVPLLSPDEEVDSAAWTGPITAQSAMATTSATAIPRSASNRAWGHGFVSSCFTQAPLSFSLTYIHFARVCPRCF